MLQVITAKLAKQAAPPCPGLLDEAGVVRDDCRVCGKCDDIIEDMLRGIGPTVVDDQFGCPTWSETLARQLDRLIRNPETSGIYHGVGLGFCTWYQLARRFLEAMAIPHTIAPCSTEEYPTPATRPKNAILVSQNLVEADLLEMQSWERDVDDFVTEHGHALIRELRT